MILGQVLGLEKEMAYQLKSNSVRPLLESTLSSVWVLHSTTSRKINWEMVSNVKRSCMLRQLSFLHAVVAAALCVFPSLPQGRSISIILPKPDKLVAHNCEHSVASLWGCACWQICRKSLNVNCQQFCSPVIWHLFLDRGRWLPDKKR